MDVICKCGKKFNTTLPDIERGRLCIGCKLDRSKETNLEKYGVDNPFKSEEIKHKIKESCMEKYGVDHHLKNKEILEKVKKTNKEKYGVEFVFHTEESFINSRKTMMEKYGVDSYLKTETFQSFMTKNRYIFLEKAKKTCLDRYGVDCYVKSDEFIANYPIYWQRARETCLDRYGVEFPIQNPLIFSKAQQSMFSKKEYTFPNGRKAYVRGYEPRCIDLLLQEGNNEKDIIVETCIIPVISYIKLRDDGTEYDAMYFPDIKLPDRLIEVKSTYIYEKDKVNNDRKFKACVKSGYNIDVWIFNGKQELAEIISYSKDGIILIEC